MTQMPDGAQLSPDGNYWLDTSTNEWRAVPGGAADTASNAAATAAGTAAAGAAEQTEQEKARVQAGLPADKTQLTDEHRAQYVPEGTVDAGEDQIGGEAQVVAMQEQEGGEHEGEGVA